MLHGNRLICNEIPVASFKREFTLLKMADDIDDLLDEVESKFCDKKAKKLVTKNASETQRPNLKKGDSSTNTSW